MGIFDYFKMAAMQLRKNAARSVLTVLGIAIGVAAMITVVSVGAAGEESILHELSKFGIDRVFIYPNEYESAAQLSYKDAEEIEKNVRGIKTVSAQSFYRGSVSNGARSMETDIVATGESLAVEEKKAAKYGRFITDSDDIYARNVIVLAEDTAVELFGDTDPTGERVLLKGREYEVIGVTLEEEAAFAAELVAARSYIPRAAYERQFMRTAVDEISLTAEEGENIESITEEAVALLNERHGAKSVSVVSMSQEMKNAERILDIFKLVVGAIGAVSLMVGGVGIMNIMLVTVRERRGEIGVRKAIGARDGSIMMQFLAEALVYAAVGAATGVAAGIAATWLAGALIGINAKAAFSSIALAALAAGGTGIVFGLLPARKAAKMDPVEALRQV